MNATRVPLLREQLAYAGREIEGYFGLQRQRFGLVIDEEGTAVYQLMRDNLLLHSIEVSQGVGAISLKKADVNGDGFTDV